MRRIVITVLSGMALAGLGTWASAATLKQEPAMGALKEGQRVLVDDGTCPKGQIKEVVGGNHTSVGGSKKMLRQRRCIPRK
ncbi:DUF6719 family protein [Hyphomicrobium sp. CS1BSMeth3]|uniref:DUF6719 family protein n=1 Tax=Hyphomicrobium sp. CS1BSMeth3 TaxID=1892844 RepID=UPI0009303A95|nr:DUF6719 family protein [Hyphomicrobium sp. CS1BSMeth3]